MESSFSLDQESSKGFLSLPLREFCDLLEGASWEKAFSHWIANSGDEKKRVLPIIQNRFSNPRQFLSVDPPSSSVSALESLWLKWRLFSALCAQSHMIHREHRSPHLGLHPDHLGVQIPVVTDPLLPARWNFQLSLSSMEGAQSFFHDPIPSKYRKHLFIPQITKENLFHAPELRSWPLGLTEKSTVLIQTMERNRQGQQRSDEAYGEFEVHLLSEKFPSSVFTEHDVFQVILPLTSTWNATEIKMWGTPTSSRELGVVLQAQTDSMPIADWERLEQSKDRVFTESTVVVYRAYQVPADLYSLGMILFWILIGRDEDTLFRLEAVLPSLTRSIEELVDKSGRTPDRNRPLSPHMLSEVRALVRKQSRLFSKSMLLPTSAASSAEFLRIPDDLWHQVLFLGFRLLMRIQGFGFCGHATDCADDHPEEVMAQVLSEVEQVGKWMHMELFGSQQRNRDIFQACQILRKERLKGESVNHAV